MSQVVLFHSALGLRPGVHWFADRLRDAGHTVHTPDLYGGEVFDSLDEGVAKGDAIGMPELVRRASEAIEPLGHELVYAGFSLGAGVGQALTQTRPGARGTLLYHDALETKWFETPWPAGVPLQVHTMDQDPWVDLDVARELAAQAGGELYLYPGDGHLFADPDLDDYDEAAAELMIERTLVFLS